MTVREAALAWAARGFKVFRCHPGRKEPVATRWYDEATNDPLEVAALWTRDFNVGVLCDGMIVVDCDVKHGKQGPATYLDLDLPLGTLAVKTPTGGLHFYLAGPSTRNRAEIAPGIDVRSAHGYVLAPGSVLAPGVYNTCPAGGAYTLLDDAPMADCPQGFIDLIGAPRERQSADPLVELDGETATAMAVQYLEDRAELAIEGAAGDHSTYAAACGVRDFGISEDLCYDLMLDHYNDRCSPPWEPDHLRIKVENAYAYAENQPGSKSPEHLFEGVNVPEPEYKAKAPRSKVIWAGDDDEFEEEWALFERLPRTGTAMMVGPTNSGKTFISYTLAQCMATGAPFFGVVPDYRCGTIVLAAEGLSGARKRMKAMKDLPVAVLPVGSLGDAKVVAALVLEIEDIRARMALVHDVPLGLIVIDTLTAAGILQDENNNSECGMAIKAMATLSQRFDCLVIVNHHPPKNGTGPRGGGALSAGVDTVVEVFREGASLVRQIECTKSREGRTGPWGTFTLPVLVVGVDSRGRPRTTCDVSMSNEAYVPASKEPNRYDKFEAAFDAARTDGKLAKDEPIPREELRVAFRAISGIPDRGNASKAFKDCLEYAVKTGAVEFIVRGGQELISDQIRKDEQ